MKNYIVAIFSAIFAAIVAPASMAQSIVIYYPTGNPGTSTLSLEQVISEPQSKTIKVRYVIRNITDEVGGNGQEVIVDGIDVLRPLPPEELLTLKNMTASMGKLHQEHKPLPICKQALLDRLEGFPPGNAKLQGSLMEQLDRIEKKMNKSDAYWLVGHTDNTGSSYVNEKLSIQRANTVLDALKEAGFSATNIKIIGKGEKDPIEAHDDLYGQYRNRRVDIYPATYPLLHWTIPALKPDEQATLEIVLEERTWTSDVQANNMVRSSRCYRLAIHTDKSIATVPNLKLSARIRPQGPGYSDQWSEEAEVSRCDSLQLQVGISNGGPRSASQIQLVSRLPGDILTTDLPKSTRQTEDSKGRRLVFTRNKLTPDQEWNLQFQVKPSTKPSVGDKTEIHKLSIKTREGFTAEPASNKIHWRTPKVALDTKLNSTGLAGDIITQDIQITNDGQWPIHKLMLVGNLPKDVHLINSTDAKITNSQARWNLGKLAPQEKKTIQLKFTVRANKNIADLKTRFIAYDQQYGDEKKNSCFITSTDTSTKISSVSPPKLTLSGKENAVGLGDSNQYLVTLTNPNAFSQTYTLNGAIDSKIWQLISPTLEGKLDNGKSLKLKADITPKGTISIHDTDKDKGLTLPANSTLTFTLPLKVNGLGSRTMKAIANNLSSNFNVGVIKFSVETLNQFVAHQAVESTIVFE